MQDYDKSEKLATLCEGRLAYAMSRRLTPLTELEAVE